jgi:transposase
MLVMEEAVEIRVLSRQGKSIRAIARTLRVSRNTVRRYLRGQEVPRYRREPRATKLDHYKQYIGCTSSEQLRQSTAVKKREMSHRVGIQATAC